MVKLPAAFASGAAVQVAALALVVGGCGSVDRASSDGDPGQTGQADSVSSTSTDAAPPAEPPDRIVALTSRGDIVVIDRVSMVRKAKLASFPWERDAETGIIYGRADDLTALADGRLLVSTCCEPAAGDVYLVDKGERVGEVNGWDPQVDAAGTRVAIGGILGIAVHEAPLASRPLRTLEAAPGVSGHMPEDPSWSPDGRELAFTSDGRLGRVPVTAESLAGAEILEPADGTFWSSPAYTSDGIVAVEQTGVWAADRAGPSRLVSVDVSTGEAVELATSPSPITDVSVDASGRYLLWVDSGRLRWRIDGVTSTVDGDFVAAAWFPEPAARS